MIFFLRNFSFLLGCILVTLNILITCVSFIWTPYDIGNIAIQQRFLTPSITHWFGTDHFGRDIFSMILIGVRNSIVSALAATSIGLILGSAAGYKAGFHEGDFFDLCVMRFNNIIFSFPALISAIIITAVWGYRTENAILALAVFNTAVFARITRASTILTRPSEFITAAQAIGKSTFGIISAHVMPNTLNLLLAQASIQFSICILAEISLSYAGFGVQPPQPVLGRMLADAQTMIGFAPHTAYFPGIAIFFIILGFTLFSEGFSNFLENKQKIYLKKNF